MMITNAHAEYLELLRVAGCVFSPMSLLPRPLLRGGREFWTVEALWQGTKVVRVVNTHLIDQADLQFEVLESSPASSLIWFPAAGRVRSDFKRSVYFRCLKAAARHNRARNKRFGAGNWAFAGWYLPDEQRILADRDEALNLIHRPAYRAQLAAHPSRVDALKRLLADGTVRITAEMRACHPHLDLLVELLSGSATER